MQEPMADVMVDDSVQQSMAMWMLHSLGPYALLLPLAALVSFALCLFLVLRGRNAWGGAAACVLVPMPLLLSLFGGLQGAMASFMVISNSQATPKPSEVAAGISAALVIPYVGLLLTAPGYLVAVIGLLARSFAPERREAVDEPATQSHP